MIQQADLKLQNGFAELLKNYRQTYRTGMLDQMDQSELTFKQFIYLDAILKMDKPTYGDIAKKFNITKPSVTAMVNKLISLGYLQRIQSEDDRRVYHIIAGSMGSGMLAAENNAVAGMARHITSCLSETELALYITLTQKINANYMPKDQK